MFDIDPDDTRLVATLAVLDYESQSELSQSDHERVEDLFIARSNELLVDLEAEEAKLRAAGFCELADKLVALNQASDAYDFVREHL